MTIGNDYISRLLPQGHLSCANLLCTLHGQHDNLPEGQAEEKLRALRSIYRDLDEVS